VKEKWVIEDVSSNNVMVGSIEGGVPQASVIDAGKANKMPSMSEADLLAHYTVQKKNWAYN